MRRKFLSVVLCVCMMLTMAPFAFAAENSETPTGAAQGQESSSGSGGSSSNSLPEADSNGIITLTESVSIPAGPTTTAEIEGNLWTNLLKNDTTIDLNGKTLTLTTGGTIIVPEGKSFTIKNGTIQANNYGNGTISVFSASKDSKIIFDNITMVTNGAAIFPAGNATSATITNSNITAGTYAVGTNAQTKNGDLVYSYNINVTIENSTLSTTGYNNNDGDTCTVMINVPGTLNIENSTIIGSRQAVVARGGVTSIADSTITLTSPYNGSDKNNYDTTTWGSGNNLPMAALVVGNHADAYKYPATCTLNNTTVTAPDGYKTVYTYGMKSTGEIDRTVTFSADGQSNVGTIVADGIANVKAFSDKDNHLYTFANAMAENKSNLTLLHNLSVPAALVVRSNKTVDINLGGNTLIGNNAMALAVIGSGNATLRNGTITSTGLADNDYVVDVDCNTGGEVGDASLTIEKDAIIEAPTCYGVAVYGNNNSNTATVNIKGTINAYSSAFSGNGLYSGTTTTISDGATLTSTNGVAIYHPQNGTLTIKDATITGLGGIESKSGESTVTVEDAYITATGSVKHVTNNNGNSSEGYAVAVVENSNYQGSPKFIIKNGHFTGPIEVLKDNQVSTNKTGSISISGGYFTVAPSAAYLDTDKVVIPSTEPGYLFTIGEKATNTTVEPTTGNPVVNSSISDSIDKVTAETVGASIKDTNNVLSAAANEAVKNVSEQDQTAAKAALKTALPSASDNSIKIYAETYLKVTPTSVGKNSDNAITSITMDIQPMYRIVASTKTDGQNFDFDGNDKNALVLPNSEKPLNIQSMEISLELPTGFATAGRSVYVQHKGHEYIAAVTDKQISSQDTATTAKQIATFTNPDGFSEFTISKNPVAVATIGQNRYTTLQDAINAVKDNETIEIVGSSKTLTATVSGNKTFTVNANSNTVTLTAASGYTLTKDDAGKYTVSPQSSGGPGSSGGSISTPTTYAVNVNAATNGAVAADKKTASKGTTVTVTASPSKGYVVDAVKVVDKDGKDVAVTEKDGKYVFTMPASAVTVTGSFKAETPAPVALPFTDVKSGNWFYDAVKYAYAQGLMTGTSATTFAPNGTMNRAMIVTVLYRLEKSPAVTGASKFTDVPAGQWYSDAVAWAAANKIVNGYDETTFGPMNAVTREQMAAILFRYEQVKGLENVTLEENLNRFPDQNKISAYAIPALQWAVGQKIINGNADGTLDPTGTATRAQVAQIFTNLLNQ